MYIAIGIASISPVASMAELRKYFIFRCESESDVRKAHDFLSLTLNDNAIASLIEEPEVQYIAILVAGNHIVAKCSVVDVNGADVRNWS